MWRWDSNSRPLCHLPQHDLDQGSRTKINHFTWTSLPPFSCGVLKYKICGIWPLVGFVPLKLNEHDVNVKVVPSGPLTVEVPPSPLLVRPPWLRSRRPYLTCGRIATGFSNLSSAMSLTQSSEE